MVLFDSWAPFRRTCLNEGDPQNHHSCVCSSDLADVTVTVAPFQNLLRNHEVLENGTAWSNSSESSDDSSSPQLSAGGLCKSINHKVKWFIDRFFLKFVLEGATDTSEAGSHSVPGCCSGPLPVSLFAPQNVIVTPEVQPVVSRGGSSQPDISACLAEPSSSTPKSLRDVSVPGDGPGTRPMDGARYTRSKVPRICLQPRSGVASPSLIGWDLIDREEGKSWRKQPSSTADPSSSQNYSRSLSHISEGSTDGVLVGNKVAPEPQEEVSFSSGMSISDIEMEVSSRSPEPSGVAASDRDAVPRRLSFSKDAATADGGTSGNRLVDEEDLSAVPAAAGDADDLTYVARCVAVEEAAAADERDGVADSGLEEALGAVVSSLDDYRGQFPELQLLEDELKLLQVNLKVRFLPAGTLFRTVALLLSIK